jgi:hypothetical protein
VVEVLPASARTVDPDVGGLGPDGEHPVDDAIDGVLAVAADDVPEREVGVLVDLDVVFLIHSGSSAHQFLHRRSVGHLAGGLVAAVEHLQSLTEVLRGDVGGRATISVLPVHLLAVLYRHTEPRLPDESA